MTYEAWTWIMIGLIIVAILGLIGTIALDMSRRASPGALTGARTVLSVIGILGAAGFALLSLGVFPFGHPGATATTPSGVTTGQTGIVTQGQKAPNGAGQ